MSLFRRELARVESYVPSPSRPGHRLHLNESPADLPAELKREVTERLAALDWSRYPEETHLLREELAKLDGWRPDGVLVGNGSNEFLQVLMLATLEAGDVVVLPAPVFSLYATQATINGAKLVEVPLRSREDEPFAYDVDAFIEAANTHGAKLVAVVSPNNPTGSVLSADELKRLHDSTRCLVAVDEAYRHFAGQDFAPLLASCERLVLMRTFSKSYAAAALRIGWVLASPALCHELAKVLMPYNLGISSCAIARALVARPELVEARVREVVAERERVTRALSELPSLRVETGGANFVVVEHASKKASELAKALGERRLLVRDLGGYAGCSRCLRISVGTPEANDLLIQALREPA